MNVYKETTKENNFFSNLANTWWDEMGPFKALHGMNPLRIQYILQQIQRHIGPKKPLSILDVGCGGGLLCEPLARLGHHVTGIDHSLESLEIAKYHAADQGLIIHYLNQDLDELQGVYDVITILEVLEHVQDPVHLLKKAKEKLATGGLIFFSTFNRNFISYFLGIVMAENILKWAPKGTHQWDKFLRPSEIVMSLENLGIQTLDVSGIRWSLRQQTWKQTNNLGVNYIGVGQHL